MPGGRGGDGGGFKERQEMKMLILATVNYGKSQITQCWEFLQTDQNSYIVLHESNDGKLVIPLDGTLINSVSPEILAPNKTYKGSVNAADAINLK
jgi:hypothetical protein